MSHKKSNHLKSYQEKTILDNVLWFIENYLPQKKKRLSREEFRLDKLESEIIKKFRKLAYTRSQSLNGDLSNTKITFTVGNWALPYLNLLKKIKFIK